MYLNYICVAIGTRAVNLTVEGARIALTTAPPMSAMPRWAPLGQVRERNLRTRQVCEVVVGALQAAVAATKLVIVTVIIITTVTATTATATTEAVAAVAPAVATGRMPQSIVQPTPPSMQIQTHPPPPPLNLRLQHPRPQPRVNPPMSHLSKIKRVLGEVGIGVGDGEMMMVLKDR